MHPGTRVERVHSLSESLCDASVSKASPSDNKSSYRARSGVVAPMERDFSRSFRGREENSVTSSLHSEDEMF